MSWTRGRVVWPHSTTQVQRPIYFGVCLGRGEFLTTPEVRLDGEREFTQVNVRKLWSDGSLKHIFVVVRDGFTNAFPFVKTVEVSDRPPRNATNQLSLQVNAAQITADVVIVSGSTTWTASVDSTRAQQILDAAVAGTPDPELNLTGTYLADYQTWVTPVDGNSNPHPWLRVRFIHRILHAWSGAQIDFTIESCPFPASATAAFTRGVHYGDVPFSSVSFRIGGVEAKNLSSAPVTSIPDGTRCRVIGWAGTALKETYFRQDPKYLGTRHFLPLYDYTRPVDPVEVATLLDRKSVV